MGTRVDFYVGRGEDAEWLGSYPFDGYPDGVFDSERPARRLAAGDAAGSLFGAVVITEEQWRAWVASWLTHPDKVGRSTLPGMGWPWPWETSATTDYAYALDDGAVYGSCFGHAWFKVDPTTDAFGEPEEDESGKVAVFPDMSAHKAVTYGPRSGLIMLSLPLES